MTLTISTEQFNANNEASSDLPWGAALVPDWWTEVTPHHLLDFNEIEEQRRREAARMSALRAHQWGSRSKSPDGSVASSVDGDDENSEPIMAGPYDLPGFQGSDGISDASFVGPGDQRWNITQDGFFYTLQDPSVRYTAAQMVESGHLPHGMDACFDPGWDRALTLNSPSVDTSLYARSEASQWQRPDWLKKKLRTTDEGIALRHGMNDGLEARGRSKSPGNLRRYQDDDQDIFNSPTTTSPAASRSSSTAKPVVVTTPPRSSIVNKQTEDIPEWKKRHDEFAKKKQQSTTAASLPKQKEEPIPEWKKRHDEFAKKKQQQQPQEEVVEEIPSTNEAPPKEYSALIAPPEEPKEVVDEVEEAPVERSSKEDATPTNDTNAAASVPSWKKSQEQDNNQTSNATKSTPPWMKKTKDEESTATLNTSTVPSWKKKQIEDKSSITAPPATANNNVPAWKKKQQEDNSTPVIPAVPAWQQKRQQPVESASASASASAPASTAKQDEEPTKATVPAWKKPQQETQPPQQLASVSASVASSVESTSRPGWKKDPEEKKTHHLVDPPATTKLNLKPKAAVPTSLQSLAPGTNNYNNNKAQQQPQQQQQQQQQKPEPPQVDPAAEQEARNLVSQGFVLKLLSLDDDASRAKELRNTIAPTKQNRGNVMVKPNELLLAIAHHAQAWKREGGNKAKIDSLRQVAIIARLVIMKLYGASSPELKQFEDGLRPAFS